MDSIQSTYLLCLSCSSNHNCHLLRKSTSNIWLFILSYCKFIIIHAKNILIFNFRCSSTFHLATFASHTWCHYWWHYSLNIRSYQSDRFWWRGHNNVNAISNIFLKKSLSKRLIKLTCCSKHQTIIVKCQAKGLSVALCTIITLRMNQNDQYFILFLITQFVYIMHLMYKEITHQLLVLFIY